MLDARPARWSGMPDFGDAAGSTSASDVFMGHEFAAEVLEAGPDTAAPGAGHARDVDPDPADDDGHPEPIVYSNDDAGGLRRADAAVGADALEVPNGLDPRHAALTEPMAVGLHAVNKSRHQAGRGRARARLRAGRPGGDRRAGAARASSRSWPPTSRRPGARWPPRWAPTRWSTPRPSRRSTPGPAPAAARRSSSSRRSAFPASSTTCCAGAPHAHPAAGGRRVHGARHDQPRSSASPRS